MSDAYVIDPSALIQGFINEPYSQNVLALLDQVPDAVELHSSEFCLVECGNILWKHVRFHGMPRSSAEQATRDLQELTITIYPTAPILSAALTTGLDNELAVYDSVYIALAQTLQLPLITTDSKQERVAMQLGIVVKSIADFAPTP